MATKKKLLQAAAGSAGGAALNVEDVFSTYLYEGNGASQAIDNGIALGDQYDGGSANFTNPDEGYPIQLDGTISLTGDFTVEAFVNIDTVSSNNVILGSDYGGTGTNHQFGINASSGYLFTYSDPTFRESTTAVSVGTWQHIAISRSGSTIYFWVDGVAAGTGTDSNTFSLTCIGALEGYTGTDASFEGYMSNLRVSNNARYTSAFTAPTSDLADDANTLLLALQSTDPFTDQSGTYTLTADSSVKSSTFGPYYADAGEGGMVWAKSRGTTDGHFLFDTERGATKRLRTHGTNAENTDSTSLTSFNANGFSIGSNASLNNSAGTEYASWTWRKAPKFFDIQTWTGDGTGARTLNHDLDHTVGFMTVKGTNSTAGNYAWPCYHKDMGAAFSDLSNPAKYRKNLYQNGGATSDTNTWNNTSPTTTQFTVGTDLNQSGINYVAYLWAHHDGDGTFGPDGDQDIIKCGHYTGDGTTGFNVDLGFEPQWLMVTRIDTDSTFPEYQSWIMQDTFRGLAAYKSSAITYGNLLHANYSAAEGARGNGTAGSANNPGLAYYTHPNSTDGFYVPDGSYVEINRNTSAKYAYVAIRRGPMAAATSATPPADLFSIDGDTFDQSSAPQGKATHLVDLILMKQYSSISNWLSGSRLQGNNYLVPNDTSAEQDNAYAEYDFMEAWNSYTSSVGSYISYHWKRAPAFCDVVAYTGNGTRGHAINHSLAVVPEMIWCKNRDQPDRWICYHSAIGNDKKLTLDDTSAASASDFAWWAKTDPTDQVFYLGESAKHNTSGENHIAYLFATLDGVSKVGSYTGNGTSQNIDCGFSNGARFILIKRTDATGDWGLVDTERGIVAGNDNILYLNDSAAELTGYDVVDPYSSGFTVTSSFNNWNANGGTYIFYAIA